MKAATGFVAGLLFGAGLLLSGMTNPARVLGFLDVAGPWDPSLAFVMGGGLLVATPLFWLTRRRGPVQRGAVRVSSADLPVDRPLVVGAILFGMGWGIAGMCPGPALLALVLSPMRAAAFVVPMLAGLAISRMVFRQDRD